MTRMEWTHELKPMTDFHRTRVFELESTDVATCLTAAFWNNQKKAAVYAGWTGSLELLREQIIIVQYES